MRLLNKTLEETQLQNVYQEFQNGIGNYLRKLDPVRGWAYYTHHIITCPHPDFQTFHPLVFILFSLFFFVQAAMEASMLPWLAILTMKFSKVTLRWAKRPKLATMEPPMGPPIIRGHLQRVHVPMPAQRGRLLMKKKQIQHFGFLTMLWLPV